MTSATGPRAALEIEKELMQQVAPADFLVTLRLHGAGEPAAPCTALSTSLRSNDEVATLRARIDKLSKTHAQERRTFESTIRKLKEVTKTGSRDVYRSLGNLETKVMFLETQNLEVSRQLRYYRKLARTLGKEAELKEAMLKNARADADMLKRRCREAESLLGRKEQQLERSNERRVAVLAHHKDQTTAVRLAQSKSSDALHTAEKLRARLQEKEQELARALKERDELRDGEGHEMNADEKRMEEDEEGAAEPCHEQAESVEASEDECEQLAGVTKSLVYELYETRKQVRALETEMKEQAKLLPPPKYIQEEAIRSGRSKRRKSQVDTDYLEGILKQRPWAAQDLARALESANQLEGVLDSRQVRRVRVTDCLFTCRANGVPLPN